MLFNNMEKLVISKIFQLICLWAILVASPPTVYGQLKSFTKINQSTTTNELDEFQSSVSGNNMYVVNKRGEGSSPVEREIKIYISKDLGLTWTEKDITISNNDTSEPQVFSYSSIVVVVYEYIDVNGLDKICIARSTDYGNSFTLNSADSGEYPSQL